MLRYGFVYGPLPGLVAIGAIIAGLKLSGGHGAGASQWFGYLIMLLALSVIFFATRQYRDQVQGGVIKFGRAFMLGVTISAVAGLFYVLAWEIYLASSGVDFIADFTNTLIDQARASGLAGSELDAEIARLEDMKSQYAKPYIRLPITFAEIFPVGVLVSLVTAAILRAPRARHPG